VSAILRAGKLHDGVVDTFGLVSAITAVAKPEIAQMHDPFDDRRARPTRALAARGRGGPPLRKSAQGGETCRRFRPQGSTARVAGGILKSAGLRRSADKISHWHGF